MKLKGWGAGYFISVYEEARKVIWPTRETVFRHTIMVVVSVAIAMLIFAGLDYGLQKAVIWALGV